MCGFVSYRKKLPCKESHSCADSAQVSNEILRRTQELQVENFSLYSLRDIEEGNFSS